MLNLLSQSPLLFLFLVAGLLLAVTLHEFMHAWTANYLGDPTAKYMGRISLNPKDHLDLYGTLAILLIGIGWGKPVQINERNFKNPRLGSAITSLAGPMTNLAIAVIFSIPVLLGAVPADSMVYILFFVIVRVNILLMILNLIPIPPLDGSKVLYYFLPRSIDIVKLEMYGPMILLALIFFSFLSPTGGIFNIIFSISQPILNLLGFSSMIF
ncbi:site-2 protease family protein [candidate division WS5 bacterium]|uniref:Site-2 protease family protein n=1 Tax=candidate division WS5 bacterium TaxID=2093353 RepID=A0A419DFQ2_9BACT|nr:MAG: site-2 protease family protein [candidate division WS5 bacterium]